MQHVVPALLCLCQVRLPLAHVAHPFRDNGEDDQPVEGNLRGVLLQRAAALRSREWHVRVGKNGRAGLDGQDRVYIEVPLAALDALALGAVVILDPVDKRAGVRDGQVNLDGLGERRGEPEKQGSLRVGL